MQTNRFYGMETRKNGLDNFSSQSNPTVDTYDSLKEAFRTLQGHYVELQIELQSAKTDRDSLLLELRASKEALENISGGNYYGPVAGGPTSLMSDMSASVYTSEKSVKDLRDILRRKEEMIDKLLADLADEKHNRANIEQKAKSDMIRYLTEIEEVKRKSTYNVEQSHHLKEEINLHNDQRKAMLDDLHARDKIIEELNEKYRLQSQTMMGLVTQIESLKTEIHNIKSLKEASDATILDLNRSLAEAKSDIEIIITERNSLRSLVAQQDAALRVQSDQSDASLGILQQRQALIDKFQGHTRSVEDELAKLQNILQMILSRNGDEMMADLVDLRHLVDVVSNARKSLSSSTYGNNASGSGIASNFTSPTTSPRFNQQGMNGGFDYSNTIRTNNVINTNSIMTGQNSTPYPLANTNNYTNAHTHTQENGQQGNALSDADLKKIKGIVEENEYLRAQSAKAMEEARNARNELEMIKVSMQKEYEALWITVHELNKLDNARDLEMKDLIQTRDQAVAERNAANDRLRRLGDAYMELEQELKIIDENLLAVAEAEDIQIVRSDTRRRIHTLLKNR